jgi:hypothetical protein
MGLGFGISDDAFGAGIGAFWTIYNMGLMVMTVKIATRPVQKRQSVRFRAHVAVENISDGGHGVGLTADVSAHGCTLLWPTPLTPGTELDVKFFIGGEILRRTIMVRKKYRRRSRTWSVHGVEFVSQDQADLDRFHDLIHEVVVPDLFGGMTDHSSLLWMWNAIRSKMVRVAAPRARRQSLIVPVRLMVGGRSYVTVTRDISQSGISVVSPIPIDSGTVLELQLTAGDTVVTLGGVVVRGMSQADNPELGTRLVGVKLDNNALGEAVVPLRAASAA